MKISRNDWQRYTAMLARLNGRAADQMQTWMDRHPAAAKEQIAAIAFALATKYGEASAALTCDMYDEIAAAQGARVPAAEPAETATYAEAAKAIYGTMKNGQSTVPATTSRLVKQAGADTMLQNAARDGAEFAWVPMGDTCAFCLTLASRGWQRQSKKARDRHASHIHANCDCEYCVRFDGKSTVQGYDPDKYLEMYENAEGSTPQEKINAMRRQHYADNAPTIRAQKRAAYAARREREKEMEKDRNLPEPLSRIYVNHADKLYRNLLKVEPIKGFEDFGIHGVLGEPLVEYETTLGEATRYTAKEFAEILRKDAEYHGGDIRLLSCGAGSTASGFAQELADELGVNVLAPTETLWTADGGELFISDSDILAELWYNDYNLDHSIKQTGRWELFRPR